MTPLDHLKWVQLHVPIMAAFINLYGYDAFSVATFYGAWNEGLTHYIHPYPELKDTELFTIIQQAACDCFV